MVRQRRRSRNVASDDAQICTYLHHAIRLCILSGITVLALSGCTAVETERKCNNLAQLGSKQYQDHQYAQAEETYQSGILSAKDSGNVLQYPLMLRELSRSQLAQKKFEAASQNLQTAISYYDDLANKPHNSRFDQAVIDEREYETLALLGDVLLGQQKYLDAKRAYARAIALSKKFVEPSSIALAVEQNYAVALEKTGEHALAAEVQQKIDDSYFTIDEFDDQFLKAVAQVTQRHYADAQKVFERLFRVSKRFVGDTSRCGKAETYLGFFQIAHNDPVQAEASLQDAIKLMPRNIENMTEICHAYALLGLARELQGDTQSGIEYYRAAFAAQRFMTSHILLRERDALSNFGHPREAELVQQRIAFLASDPRFKAIPVTALDYVMLSRQQTLMGKAALARQTELKGLAHLEQNSSTSGMAEMRGAFQLYKRFTTDHNQSLANRALKQLYAIGNRTTEGKVQLQKIVQRENLPLLPPG
ncbi:MAG TPA: hypothetical protein V6C89_10345 [Drouetiella sp.]|jgi:tetratricopeptide (TPR) repeat protein